jgi:hypothetical protein
VFGPLHVIIDLPPRLAARSTAFWSSALGWPAGSPWSDHPEFRSLEPATGDAYVHLQTAGEGPRVHVDVQVEDVATETERLVGLGARALPRQADWQTLLSPGGLPFCLLPQTPRVMPAPLTTPEGHRLRLVQVCLDLPPSVTAAEERFWRSASGWRWVPSDAAEFAGKLHHDGTSPVQLLLQRLGGSDPGRSRAHLDLGTDDVDAAVARLVGLGAERGATGGGWVVLTDPVGMVFCVTGNAPD